MFEPADCQHIHISLDPEPGRGYTLKCHDCGNSGFGVHAKAAHEEFEHKIQTAKRITAKRGR